MKKLISYVVAILLVAGLIITPQKIPVKAASLPADDYLHVNGNKILDQSGNQVRLTGIAWFGYETTNAVFHGIWSVTLESVLDKVADNGFNLLRIPISVQLVNQWRKGVYPMSDSVNTYVNPGLTGKNSLEILDTAIAYCKQKGIKVMFDMHRVVNTQQLNLWYNDTYSVTDFEESWKWLATHYKNDDTVIACDLFNEPHGTPGQGSAAAKWDGSMDQNNWRYEAGKVGQQILAINPNLLIVVEGIEATPKTGHTYGEPDNPTNSPYDFDWWGGNLRGVANYPVNLGTGNSQIVYSPHDYGPSVSAQPWLQSGFTKESLTTNCWDPNWLYIHKQNIAPILVGEWGGRLDGGDNQKWLTYLAQTIAENNLNHTFWCMNPNSGDTGGILKDDWVTIDADKYNIVKQTLWKNSSGKFIGLDHQVNLGANGTHVGGSTSTPTNTPTISPTVTPTIIPTITPTVTPRVTPTVTPTVTPRVTPTITPTQAATGIVVTYTVSNRWDTGANINVTIKNNTTTAINGWTLAWSLPSGQSIANMWNAAYTTSGSTISVTNLSHTATIPGGGGTQSFGFNLNYSGTFQSPSAFTLNGTPCQIQ